VVRGWWYRGAGRWGCGGDVVGVERGVVSMGLGNEQMLGLLDAMRLVGAYCRSIGSFM